MKVFIKTDSIESAFSLSRGDAPMIYRDPHGKPYDTLTHAGVKPEGTGFKWLADSPDVAIREYLEQLYDYIHIRCAGDTRVIYWRWRPELIEEDGKWAVRSRLSLGSASEVAA
jgi:hypothetical protein